MKKLNLETFELSQSYPLFWDKLEKSNYFLENILDTLDEPTNGRLIAYLLSAPAERRRPVGYALQPDRQVRRGAQGPPCLRPPVSSATRRDGQAT